MAFATPLAAVMLQAVNRERLTVDDIGVQVDVPPLTLAAKTSATADPVAEGKRAVDGWFPKIGSTA